MELTVKLLKIKSYIQNKIETVSIWLLLANVFAVSILGLLCLSWVYSIDSVLLGALLNLFTLPSIALVIINLFSSFYFIFITKEYKISVLILFLSLVGVGVMLYMQANWP